MAPQQQTQSMDSKRVKRAVAAASESAGCCAFRSQQTQERDTDNNRSQLIQDTA